MVHTSRLRLSPYFDAMLNRNNNTSTGRLHLPEMDPYTVKLYIHFLYNGTLATDIAGADNGASGRSVEARLLCELYEFGLLVKDFTFKNAILDTIIDISYLKDKDGNTHIPHPNFVCKPHLLTTQARRCIIDLYVHTLDPENLPQDGEIDPTFMREVLKASLKKWDMQVEKVSIRRQSVRKCDYHEHPDGIRCADVR